MAKSREKTLAEQSPIAEQMPLPPAIQSDLLRVINSARELIDSSMSPELVANFMKAQVPLYNLYQTSKNHLFGILNNTALNSIVNNAELGEKYPKVKIFKKRVEDKITSLTKAILDSEENCSIFNPKGESCFFAAAKNGNVRAMQIFLAMGATPLDKQTATFANAMKFRNANFATPLILAAQNNRIPSLMPLLDGANVNARDNKGFTALNRVVCAEFQNLNYVKELIKAGADVNLSSYDNFIPLIFAVRRKKIATLQLLIAAKAKLNVKDKEGNTALIFAAVGGLEAEACLLIHAGADVNKFNNDGDTALMIAIFSKNFAVARQLLISKKIKLGILNNDGVNAVHYALEVRDKVLADIYKNVDVKLLRFLLEFHNKLLSEKQEQRFLTDDQYTEIKTWVDLLSADRDSFIKDVVAFKEKEPEKWNNALTLDRKAFVKKLSFFAKPASLGTVHSIRKKPVEPSKYILK